MRFSLSKPLSCLAALTATGAVVALPAWATPTHFTANGTATTYSEGHTEKVPNTLYFNNGKIRLEMAPPLSGDSGSAFSVVLAHEGGTSIVMLNPHTHQAMRLSASSLQSISDNPALQKIASFRLSEFGGAFKAQSHKVGSETIAGQACTVYDHKDKHGHLQLCLGNQTDLPMRFTYYTGAKPAFSYQMDHLSLSNALPASSFQVPGGYQMTDLTEMLRKQSQQH
jgi:hypothetical protein